MRDDDLRDPGTDLGDLDLLVRIDGGIVGHLDAHDEDPLVQRRLVREIDEKRRRYRAWLFEEVGGSARQAEDVIAREALAQLDEWCFGPRHPLGDEFTSLAPRRHLDHEDERDQQREPAAVGDLRDTGGQEREVDDQQRIEHDAGLERRPTHPLPGHPVEQQCGDRHRDHDRDAVRRGEVARRAESEHQPDARDHQEPVDERHVDLTDVVRRCVVDGQARDVVELERLSCE